MLIKACLDRLELLPLPLLLLYLGLHLTLQPLRILLQLPQPLRLQALKFKPLSVPTARHVPHLLLLRVLTGQRARFIDLEAMSRMWSECDISEHGHPSPAQRPCGQLHLESAAAAAAPRPNARAQTRALSPWREALQAL